MKFSEFNLSTKLQNALKDKGYEDATEIQEKTLIAFQDGKHIVGQSQTWSGKTAAFVLPILNSIDTRLREPQALILAPTRELAAQIRDEVYELSKGMYMRSVACFGGLSKRRQIEQLKMGPQIVIGTPWRIYDLIDNRFLKVKNLDYFVLDEVDRMLDMGFVDTIQDIWNKINAVKQILFYSATLPTEVNALINEFIGEDYTKIEVEGEIMVNTVDHMFMAINQDRKYEVLRGLLEANQDAKIVLFVERKYDAHDLALRMEGDGFAVDSLHGDMDQRERFKTLRKIKNNEIRILVATDVAARGLNMNQIDLVMNYDVPRDPESYIHRVGRTWRAGRTWVAIMLVDRSEWKFLHAIERRNKLKIKQVTASGEEVERTDRPQRSWWRSKYSRYRKSGGNRGRGGQRGWRTNRSSQRPPNKSGRTVPHNRGR